MAYNNNMWAYIMDRPKCISTTLLYFRVRLNWTFPCTIRLADIQAIPKYARISTPLLARSTRFLDLYRVVIIFFFSRRSLLGRHMATSYELILFRNQKWRRCYKSYVWARREGFHSSYVRTTKVYDNAERTNAFNII